MKHLSCSCFPPARDKKNLRCQGLGFRRCMGFIQAGACVKRYSQTPFPSCILQVQCWCILGICMDLHFQKLAIFRVKLLLWGWYMIESATKGTPWYSMSLDDSNHSTTDMANRMSFACGFKQGIERNWTNNTCGVHHVTNDTMMSWMAQICIPPKSGSLTTDNVPNIPKCISPCISDFGVVMSSYSHNDTWQIIIWVYKLGQVFLVPTTIHNYSKKWVWVQSPTTS